MTAPLTTLAELDEAIRMRCADDGVARGAIIQALIALARFVCGKLPPLPPEHAAGVAQAFSILEAWCRGARDEEPLIAAFEGLQYTLRPARKHQKVPPQLLFLDLLSGVLQAAHYEDHDDWPDEVVVAAVDLLGELGTPQAQAIQAVSETLARHEVI
ncbi:hypothetical protein [Hyalangium sp.]|uniref:hypothetical protein n=1 Tax=Hyalangium sp. TaxID=2028555 RepID=UPI002D432A42|nr:hypothetical protein [Hyalangium sp.]HYH99915.1 hypothetical protein [Hyalangium sp.]